MYNIQYRLNDVHVNDYKFRNDSNSVRHTFGILLSNYYYSPFVLMQCNMTYGSW